MPLLFSLSFVDSFICKERNAHYFQMKTEYQNEKLKEKERKKSTFSIHTIRAKALLLSLTLTHLQYLPSFL